MPYGSVQLIPGVNLEETPTLLKTGVSISQLIRYRQGLVQKLGGWTVYYSNVAGTPRDLHAWEDLNQVNHLAVGTTTQLAIITNGNAQDITPQTLKSELSRTVSTTANSTLVSIADPNISNVTVYDSVYFNVPVSQGGVVLSGLYPIAVITGSTSYQINAATNATATETNPNATNSTTAAGNNTLHFASTPAWVAKNMTIYDLTTPAAIPAGTTVSSTTGSTVVMSGNAAAPGVGSGDEIVFSSVPVFTTASGSASVTVTFFGHGLSVGNAFFFPIPTTGNGVTISGNYIVTSVTDANNFVISATTQATGNGTFAMNTTGFAELIYYIAIGPPTAGTGVGLGAFGGGGFGTGSTTGQQTGTKITATDWTSDNWGEILLACPAGGGVYQFDPTSGFVNAQLVGSAPPLNGGIFVSTSEQILVCWASTVQQTIGEEQDPLTVKWSTVGDYTNFQVLATDQAGSYRISNGSKIMCGLATPNQNLIFTDEGCWAMNYQGPPFVFGFNKIGAGAGAISSHAAMQLRWNVYWMGPSDFDSATAHGIAVLPCPVWDFVFQNLNTSFQQNVRAAPNTPFNEAGWFFPSSASTSGECDSYVKFNLTEPGEPWDYGSLPRSAWIDQTVLGPPIGAIPAGTIYQHETSNDAAGQPLLASFTTGYFFIAEGEDFCVVDQILPDFKWGFYGAAQTANIQLTFNVVNFPGDTPVQYGPFVVTQATEILSVRFRGRQMSITVSSADLGRFWRLGR